MPLNNTYYFIDCLNDALMKVGRSSDDILWFLDVNKRKKMSKDPGIITALSYPHNYRSPLLNYYLVVVLNDYTILVVERVGEYGDYFRHIDLLIDKESINTYSEEPIEFGFRFLEDSGDFI